ncbi:uncharacterized protein LOC113463986 [Ceratina calcarata]|uniref:Uncharacterized protein LOC113463986 n=1 Tax=Ceratina calcarata TaxID=156304 RepID=A0AAJ7W8K4_9HYME|nr:uncharacterized protein LOC113463986 [Ceratina calcarata]
MQKYGKMQRRKKNSNKKRRHVRSRNENATIFDEERPELKVVSMTEKYRLSASGILKRYLRAPRRNMIISSDSLSSLGSGMFETGIRYIMLPIDLLRYIFRKSSWMSVDPKMNTRLKGGGEKIIDGREEEIAVAECSNHAFSQMMGSSGSAELTAAHAFNYSITSFDEYSEEKGSNNTQSDENMMTVRNDFDAIDEWATANNTIENLLIDYNEIGSAQILKAEPMDITIEECSSNLHSLIEVSQGDQELEEIEILRSATDGQETSSIIEEEISILFQQKCTSSDEKFVLSTISKRLLNGEQRSPNYLYKKLKEHFLKMIAQRRMLRYDRRERRRKLLKIIGTKRKYSSTKRVKCKQKILDTIKDRRFYEKRNIWKTTDNKDEFSFFKTVETSEKLNRETATMRDTAVVDEDVEMKDIKQLAEAACLQHESLNLNISSPEINRQEQESHCTSSSNNIKGITYNQISSSTSCSALDSSKVDEPSVEIENSNIGMVTLPVAQRENVSDITNILETKIRPPPGFPEVPENPPLLCSCYDSDHSISSIENTKPVNKMKKIPRAPPPLRYMYYQYWAFMEFPVDDPVHYNKDEIDNFKPYYYW